MRSELSNQIDKATTVVFLVLAAFLPLTFASFTTDYFEAPKLILLFLGLIVLLLLKGVSWVLSGKVYITRTPLDLPLVLFLLVVLISAFVSPLRYISLFGNLPRVHGSAISWVLYILFYFLATSHFKTVSQIKLLFQAVILSSLVLSIVTIMSYFGAYLPLPYAQALNFSPSGSAFSTAGMIIILTPLLLISLGGVKKLISPPLGITSAVIFSVTLALVADITVIAAFVLSYALTLYLGRSQFKVKNLSQSGLLFLPAAIFLVVFLLGRVGGGTNILYTKAFNYPHELQLPFDTSWTVSASAFRDNAFFGSGPSTYLFDFTSYKPASYNATPFWNIRFDSAFNEFLQVLATEGALGLVALVFISLVVINFSLKAIRKHSDNGWNIAISLGALMGIVLIALHPGTIVLTVVIILVFASLMTFNKSDYDKVQELTIGIRAWNPTKSDLIAGDALPMISLVVIVVVVILSLIKSMPLIMADYHHRLALNAASTQGLTTYNELVKAEQLNPNVDLYRTDLAQTNFALANSIAQSKGPTQASPSGSLTDTDKQNIQTLLSQAINEGRAAVTLNPRSAQNWEILASIYRQISGVAQNALQFSLDSYGRAIQQDPLNPLLRLSVGGVYYSVKNYPLAVRFFSDAVNLKPDFANGYYNLSIALRDSGDLQSAIQAAETLVTLIDKKSPDYKTATDYLSALKAQLASKDNSASASASVPPAAQQTSALQNKNLPSVKVNELSNPPQEIATPSAVKK